MGKYVAELIGETDGHPERRFFDNVEDAIAWLQGAGLAAFPDQSANGSVLEGGRVVWARTHLRTKEQAEYDDRRIVRHVLSKLSFDKYRKR